MEENFISIIDNIMGTFNDAYAFYDISVNPPQPRDNANYHKKVDIYQKLIELKGKINNRAITEVYDFYREIIGIFSELKDSHIIINWKSFNFHDFFIIAPIEFYIQEIEGNYKIFATCLSEEFEDESDMGISNALTLCEENLESPILSINEKDPFEFIKTFGGNFLSTKNEHATFSFKLKNHNQLSLNDFPLSLEELSNLKIQFESNAEILTQYYIGSDIEIDIPEGRRRNLKKNDNNKLKQENEENLIKKKNKKRKRNLDLNEINWNYETNRDEEDGIKCYEDTTNEINVYYISSFLPDNKDNYINVINDCYNLFDKNIFPIIVVNDLNEGGLVSLSQLFLGIISPLMSIDMYKGRIRMTNAFTDTDEINYYINSNLTNIDNCLNENYHNLIDKKVTVNYGDIQSTLTNLFFINNKNIHDNIETARNNMYNKRKPTEILIYTDGYSFSAAGLMMQYLQKSGGAIIVGYLGNPKEANKIFDISQSPSPVFTSGLLKIFSPGNYMTLLNMPSNNDWEIQMPGIQSFYDSQNVNNPLEYEVIQPDLHSGIYQNFDKNSYDTFILKAKEIFDKYQIDCNPNNKNLVKVSEECNGQFGNNYTYGGYECGNDGKWTTKCVPSYCALGYFFNKNLKKCVKDVCSSIEIILDEDQNTPTNGTKKKKKNNSNKIFINMIYFLLIFLYI
jgi:hypothetical protein